MINEKIIAETGLTTDQICKVIADFEKNQQQRSTTAKSFTIIPKDLTINEVAPVIGLINVPDTKYKIVFLNSPSGTQTTWDEQSFFNIDLAEWQKEYGEVAQKLLNV